MNIGSLRRLATMSNAERMFRIRTLLHTQAERISVGTRGGRWERRHIARLLSEPVRRPIATPLARGDWPEVQACLVRRMQNRPARFMLDPCCAAELRTEIECHWPDARRTAAEAADEILAGRYALLGFEGLSFAQPNAPIDWHFDPVHGRHTPLRFWADVPYLDPACGDHKIIWELNRHQHFLVLGRAWWLTGDDRYRHAILDQLRSWLAANPPLVGVNWASMLELGLRSLSWLWAMHFLLADVGTARSAEDTAASGPWLVDLIVGLHRHLTHVERHLSYYFSPNTHLTGEALALYAAGVALPELADSARWTAIGRRVLLTEIDRQIATDGGHVERSTHYHRYTLDFYLMALLTAECAGDEQAAAAFRGAVERLASFMAAVTGPTGRFPLVGDDDGGMLWPVTGRRDPRDVQDSMAVASLALRRPEIAEWGMPEEAVWIAWHARAAEIRQHRGSPKGGPSRVVVSSRLLPETGFVVIGDDSGSHLLFDAGPHGFLNGGHAHADALAFTLDLNGHPLLIDTGTATYTMDVALRDRMRASMAHNTVTVDGRSSAVPAGPFHWKSRADAALHTWRDNAAYGWVEASHQGYAPVRHRRSIVHAAREGWLVVDEIDGEGRHLTETHWHFDPNWHVARSGGHAIVATRAGSPGVWLIHEGGDLALFHGDEATGLGWCSPRYGRLTPIWSARLSRRVSAPVVLVSWIGVQATSEPPSLQRVEMNADAGAPAIAVRVQHASYATVTVLRPGDVADRETRSADTAEYHSNARLLQYAVGTTGRVQLSMADGSHVLALRDRLISIGAEQSLRDLHVSVENGTLDLWSTSPPAILHVQGTESDAIRCVRLNGRERRLEMARAADTITVTSADWASPDDTASGGLGAVRLSAAPEGRRAVMAVQVAP